MNTLTCPIFPGFTIEKHVQNGVLFGSAQHPELLIRWNLENDDMGSVDHVLGVLASQRKAMDCMRGVGFVFPMPGMRAVIAPYRHPSTMAAALVMDRVNGQKVSIYDPQVPDEAIDQAMELNLSIVEKTVAEGGTFIGDLHVGQFILGTTASNPKSQLYYVDLDSYVKGFNPADPKLEDSNKMLFELAKLHQEVERLEARTKRNSGTEIIRETERQRICAVAQAIPEVSQVRREFLEYLQKPLAGHTLGKAAYIGGNPLSEGPI